jgi:cytochrome bd-type quinol oxidase subunit 2
MSNLVTTILIISLAGLLVGILYKNIKEKKWRRLVLSLVLMVIAVLFLNQAFSFPHVIESKGPVEETIVTVLCYFCMVLGMIAQYFYSQAERKSKKFKFDLRQFLLPFFASPIVFLPFLTTLKDVQIGGAITNQKLMIYFLAFQNGFFWRGFFLQQQQRLFERASNEKPRK